MLGLIQGITEFLPVSSSGHLALLEHVWGIKPPGVAFEVALHLGTLLAVLAYYRKDIRGILLGLLCRGKEEHRQLALSLLVACMPTAVAGIVMEAWVEALFSSLRAVGMGFLVGGTIMLLAGNRKVRAGLSRTEVRVSDAFWIGAMQSVALLPGVSRSGTTISAAILRGISRENAARFSFLLAIPVVGGASLLSLIRVWHGQSTMAISAFSLTAGLVCSAVSGYISVGTLVGWLKKRSLGSFGWYCLLMGLVCLWL